MNKKVIIGVIVVLVVAVLGGVLFWAFNKNKDDKKESSKKEKADLSQYAGTYEGKYTKLVGDSQKNEEEFSLELKKDGTGTHYRDDYSFDVTWSVDGDEFKMTETFIGDPIEYVGTLKGDDLDIFNGDPEDMWTYEYVYVKK